MACALSIEQLRSLVVEYHHFQPSAAYSILWHTSLLYIVNSRLEHDKPTDWRSYFNLCVSSYLRLLVCYPIAAGFLQGLLSIGVRNGAITTTEAKKVLAQFN